MRSGRYSLRIRLLIGGALWIALALILTGLAIFYLFVANVERSVRADLEANIARLTTLIDLDARSTALTGQMSDPRYDFPLSGFYWQVSQVPGTIIRSRSLWDFVIPYQPPPHPRGTVQFTASGPEGQSLSAAALDVTFHERANPRTYRIIVAQDRGALDESIARFGRDIVIALVLLGLALALAAFAQVGLGLRPLRALRRDVGMVRRGDNDTLGEDYPDEVMPVVQEVNALLATQHRLIDFARARAADLAHVLKTPLAVLGTVSDQLRDRRDTETADMIEDLVVEMQERIDYQLRLSRLRQRKRGEVLSTRLDEVPARIVAVIRRTADGERLDWQVEYGEALHVDIDRNDLVELLGILLENASEWAASRVSISCGRDGNTAHLLIEDDGGTLTAADLEAIAATDMRLDQRPAAGNGLGLGIAREIVALNGGALAFALSADNGLRVSTRLPLSP